MMTLLDRVSLFIREHALFRRNERILVAVSGGVDSMVLLHLLHQLAGRRGWKLRMAHFNHQLRGRRSAADERFVRRSATALGLPLVVGRRKVKAFALAQGLSIEMAARQLRHYFLARTARRFQCRTVGLGHHADDQVELFFLRLLRGAGGEGIAGMKSVGPSPSDKRIRLARPLLEVSRREILQYARENGIHFREDASNSRLDFRRNRIRHELLPLLEKQYQPGVRRTVLRLMQILGAEADCVTAAARQWLARKKPAPVFTRLPVAVQRRCLQLQLLRLNFSADFETVESLRRNAAQPVNIAAATSVARDVKGRVELQTPPRAVFKPESSRVRLRRAEGTVEFSGVRFSWCMAPVSARNPLSAPGREAFDADAVGGEMVLRHWRPGDRYQPIGMNTTVKLQDAFTNRKIPLARRRELVVATTKAGEIFWVEGLRIAEGFKLTPHTRRQLNWGWRRP
ncbi:MAG: tRNA lysidine(34) synthetase TilS [Verrucomicrobiae bacterium]|nr:tRNA lysidine(34) synthetase TilS [Verrucomicrobiae bacterium]